MLRLIGRAGLVVLLLGLVGHEAAAQEAKDVRQGRALAVRVCAICHGIRPGEASTAAGAPNFYTVAMTPGMTPLALRVALQTPHHSMPNLALTNDEMTEVTAYIFSLQPPEKR